MNPAQADGSPRPVNNLDGVKDLHVAPGRPIRDCAQRNEDRQGCQLILLRVASSAHT